ncbi:hypothetical protein RHMOL_Rhmol13G0224700 [Rhododendron molle]|uniref:Uncharacterized protein n=1 Tax=Rhododendron molle TaxID=49168 RepID=A0ACC0L9Y5_RHOML|nr:hypothetical protein RHMOL_Rhmol13G0224700 [Rhododendron molle]
MDNLKVSSILSSANGGATWNIQKICDLFLESIIPRILAIQIPTSPCNDTLVWPAHTASGKYNTKSGYRALYDTKQHFSTNHEPPSHLHKGIHIWKTLWHLDLPQRLKVFLWKCGRGILPVKLGLSTRLHHLSPICPLCESSEDSLDHLSLQCAVTQPVWLNTTFRVTNTAPSFRDWLMDWVIGLTASTDDKDRFFTFIGTLWVIWKTRNAKIFSDTPFLSSTALALAADHAL